MRADMLVYMAIGLYKPHPETFVVEEFYILLLQITKLSLLLFVSWYVASNLLRSQQSLCTNKTLKHCHYSICV